MGSMYSRRAGRIVGQTTHELGGHNRYWRQCANDEDDGLNAARGILAALAGGALCWIALAALIGVGWWAFECFARGTC